MTFHVGDRVEVINRIGGACAHPGAQGTVRAVYDGYNGAPCVVVEFDESVSGGWNCDGYARSGDGLMVRDPRELQLVSHARNFSEFVRKQERLIANAATG